jgi:hypothetical protein
MLGAEVIARAPSSSGVTRELDPLKNHAPIRRIHHD